MTYFLHFLLGVLLLAGGCSSRATNSDRETLLAVKKEFGSPPQLDSWNTTDHCSWPGVTCKAHQGSGVVTELFLNGTNLTGGIGHSVCNLRHLIVLELSQNYLSGRFPVTTLSACSRLRALGLNSNSFYGYIPENISRLSPLLKDLDLGYNNFSGVIPAAVFELPALEELILDANGFIGEIPDAFPSKELRILALAQNKLTGRIPAWIWQHQKIEELYLLGNGLAGELPRNISAVNLEVIDISENKLTGRIPESIWQLQKLKLLYLEGNELDGELPRNITAVNLVEIVIFDNKLNGSIPEAFGTLKRLTTLAAYYNEFSGTIPTSIGLLPNLVFINLFSNMFSGALPPELGKHSLLAIFYISSNNFSGSLPDHLCANGRLSVLVVNNNNLSGGFPASIGNCLSMKVISVNNNKFSGEFPVKIWSLPLPDIIILSNNNFTGAIPTEISPNISRIDMQNNQFTGSIPTSATRLQVLRVQNNQLCGELPASISNLQNLTELVLSGNKLNGSIPKSIGNLLNLRSLDLSNNNLSGAIPSSSIGMLLFLAVLDLSNNELTGVIPPDLGSITTFQFLNLSFNHLSGEVPIFLQKEEYNKSLLGNHGLCGRWAWKINLPNCHSGTHLPKHMITLLSVLGVIVLLCVMGIAAWLLFRRRKNKQPMEVKTKIITFTHLDLGFTDFDVLNNISEENVIGRGGSGKVYRVHLPPHDGATEDRIVAVKKICITDEPNDKYVEQFNKEVGILKDIRHTNIIKLLCCISSQDARLLVYEYMKNGSLDQWLHHREGTRAPLDWPTRLAIAIDVAKGLKYVHEENGLAIVHQDIKSANILLGEKFNAKISDFGLARILHNPGESQSASGVYGTHGYMSPQHGNFRVQKENDIYSFGVVLLELTTGKVANGGGAEENLAQWAWRQYQEHQDGLRYRNIIDKHISDPAHLHNILSVFKLGVTCTHGQPKQRPSMDKVLTQLILYQQLPRTGAEPEPHLSRDDAEAETEPRRSSYDGSSTLLKMNKSSMPRSKSESRRCYVHKRNQESVVHSSM